VLVLRDQFRVMREELEELTELSQWLSREYSTGTFTKNLSRNDLQAIAVQLPTRQSWSEPSLGLTGIKDSIKSEYNIGSKELSEAFRKIQDSRDLARIIGMPGNIPGLSIADLITLNDFWKLAWDRDALSDELRADISGFSPSPIVPVSPMQGLNHELQVMKDTRSSVNQFKQWATAEKLAGLQTLLDAGDYCFSEEHDSCYESYKKEVELAFSASPRSRMAEINEVWSRSIGRRAYPSRIIGKLKRADFKEESDLLEQNLFA